MLISYLLSISPLVIFAEFLCGAIIGEHYCDGRAKKRNRILPYEFFGDISHLYAHQEPPSFAARFCETYDNKEQRHD